MPGFRGLQLQRRLQLKPLRVTPACLVGVALLVFVPGCTLTADLDRYKQNDGGYASSDASDGPEPVCQVNVDCSGCSTCDTFCKCAADPKAYEQCMTTCVATGL